MSIDDNNVEVNSESVVEELLKENVNLRKEVDKLQGLTELDVGYEFIVTSLSKPVTIRGVLIAEGVWKGIKYSYEMLKRVKDRFVGIPIKVNHGLTVEFGNVDYGKVTKVLANDMLRCLTFEGQLADDEKVIGLVVNKQFDSISIRGNYKNVDLTKFPPEGNDYEPWEASLTGSPACSFCHVFNVQLTECVEEMETELGWRETTEYVRSGHKSPSVFDKDSFRTISIDETKGIKAVVGCLKGHFVNGKCDIGTEVQSFLFDKSKGWTTDKAKEWVTKKKDAKSGNVLYEEESLNVCPCDISGNGDVKLNQNNGSTITPVVAQPAAVTQPVVSNPPATTNPVVVEVKDEKHNMQPITIPIIIQPTVAYPEVKIPVVEAAPVKVEAKPVETPKEEVKPVESNPTPPPISQPVPTTESKPGMSEAEVIKKLSNPKAIAELLLRQEGKK